MGYDNDEWAKQAYGADSDSRWGKSYDSVSARSYDNEKYARWLQADDDQWAEDYDRYDSGDMNARKNGASVWTDANGYGKGVGYGYGAKGGEYDAASAGKATGYWGKSGSDWDAYGRDQDLEVDESYEATWAKSYDAESYDEWDNADDDKWGAQSWGKDRDVYGASSASQAASEADKVSKQYGYGAGYGAGYGKKTYGSSAAAGYGTSTGYGMVDTAASTSAAAAVGV